MDVLIVVITVVGLGLLAVALYKAAPPVDFGTGDEQDVINEGRRRMPLAVAIVLVAAILLASKGSWPAAALVALSALIPGAVLLLAEPYAVVGALILVIAPTALAAVASPILGRGP
jgi:hypothetical protein